MQGMVTRRNFLGMVASSSLALSAPAISRAANPQGVTRVGGLYSLSGTFANVGSQMNDGSAWALEHYGSAAGNKLQYVVLDDRGDPGEAVRKVNDFLTVQKNTFIVGATNSAIALPAQHEAFLRKGVYVHGAGADEATGVDCNQSTFRWTAACYSAVNATVRPMIDQFPKAKRWYTITGQYVFGESLLANCKSVFKEKGIEHIGNSYHSLSDREYSAIIASAIAASPDVLVICNFGNQTVDVIRQAISFGLKNKTKILAVWSTGLDQFKALGAENCEGVYFGVNYWHGVNTPGNRLIVDIAKKKTGDVPSYLQALGFVSSQIVVEGINKANSTDRGAVISALDGLVYEGPTGKESIRAGDHQVIKDYYLMVGKGQSAMQDKNDLCKIVSASKAFLPVDKTGCKMTG
jgi:branched-chain amino acid transport system substrate-binding protein